MNNQFNPGESQLNPSNPYRLFTRFTAITIAIL